MKVIHWSMKNGSGMYNVAASMARAELAMGVESRCMDPFDKTEAGWGLALDADVHVSHTHIPETLAGKNFRKQCTKPYRWVFPVHGTPEHVFESTIKDAEANGYASGMSYGWHQRGMQEADAIMAFVPRHRDLYDLATDKSTIVDLIPMGINVKFWQEGTSAGRYAGTPSFLNCDNQYPFKWGVYILRMWPWIHRELDQAGFHLLNVPATIHRFVDMMAARYGSIYGSIYGSWSYTHENLRNIMKSIDYYVSAVRYGDFNRASMEASAAGMKVISYPGNEYADYWMHEGDDRMTARDLIAIGKGDVEPLKKRPVPTEEDMAQAAIGVYERILDRPRTNWALGEVLPDALPENVRNAIISGQEMDTRARTGPRPILFTPEEQAALAAPPAAAPILKVPVKRKKAKALKRPLPKALRRRRKTA